MCAWLTAFTTAGATANVEAAPADARKAARDELRGGASHLREGRYDDALQSFRRAYDLVPSPKIHFNFGLAYAGLARWSEALRAFERFLAEAQDATAEQRAQAREQIAGLQSKVAYVQLEVQPEGAAVLLDGRNVGSAPLNAPLVVDPGPHQVVIELGDASRARALDLKPAEHATVALTLATPAARNEAPRLVPTATAVPATVPSPPAAGTLSEPVATPADKPFFMRPWVWVAAGVLVAGTVTVLLVTRHDVYPTTAAKGTIQ